MKSSEGRHYREFLPKAAVQCERHFPPILMTLGSPGVALATFGGTPGPGPQFLMIFRTLFEAAGGVREALGAPFGDTFCSRSPPGR